jgi:hypothetical protein
MSLIDQTTGQDLAREELARPEYAQTAPGLVERAFDWVGERLTDLLATAADIPGGSWVISILLLAVTLLLAVGVRRWIAQPPRADQAVFANPQGSPGVDYLKIAETSVANGDWNSGLIAATRAIVADLQNRGRVTPGAAITVSEVRTQTTNAQLDTTLLVFEDVRYGDGTATPAAATLALELAKNHDRTGLKL